jgi:hypothetical protein
MLNRFRGVHVFPRCGGQGFEGRDLVFDRLWVVPMAMERGEGKK